MIRYFLTCIFCLLLVPATSFAGGDDIAVEVEVVACVNSFNGHSNPIENSRWELTQAVLAMPYEHERFQLADGYYLIAGRMLGYHGTWAALLNLSEDEQMAFETRAKDDNLGVFAASFVPKEVIIALASCGVGWSGYWAAEFPMIDTATAWSPVNPTLPNYPINGADLLPPKAVEEPHDE